MAKGVLIFSEHDKRHNIKVCGRATFDVAPQLREFAKKLQSMEFDCIRIDLEKCEWMDSTFMGVIAMTGVACVRKKQKLNICAANEANKKLLLELGLKNLLNFIPETVEQLCEVAKAATASLPVMSQEEALSSMANGARTVLEAHETLIDVDESNRDKFGVVVDMVRQDVDRLEKTEKDSQK